MTSRTFVVPLLLLATSALAQNGIDTLPSGAIVLEQRFTPTKAASPDIGSGLIGVSDLSVPAKARKEFDKALASLHKDELKHALQQLNKAVLIYPAFTGAYNNLAVVYGRLGDAASEREALEKAIELNDHFSLAYLNWAKMSIASSDFASAQTALDKVSNLDPSDPTAFVLLAYSDLVQGHVPEAITSSEKAHALGKPHAFAHRVAARAFEQEKQFDQAICELNLYLKEDPLGPASDLVRNELQIVQALPR